MSDWLGGDNPWIEPELADEWGLVGVGGDLSPERLLRAYRDGVFPWFNEDEPICWWSPDPRAIFELDGMYRSSRLQRTIRSGKFAITFNQDFRGVMLGCADREEGTWITPSMLEAYSRLYELGHAHSVEARIDGELVGGTYGVAIGGFFAAESMFFRVSDASKVALAALIDRLKARSFTLLDIQLITEHTASLGAIEIPRNTYLRRLRGALRRTKVTFLDRP